MGLFREAFAWWTGNTWGTRWTIMRVGRFVGQDEMGNRYFEQRSGTGPNGKPRRWVVYKDFAEATKISPDWHGWMHSTVDIPPTEQSYTPHAWQQPHRPNPTGTPGAIRPAGSILSTGKPAGVQGQYSAWKPD